jgi:hypothetical protein
MELTFTMMITLILIKIGFNDRMNRGARVNFHSISEIKRISSCGLTIHK